MTRDALVSAYRLKRDGKSNPGKKPPESQRARFLESTLLDLRFAFRALVDPDGSRQGPHAGYTFVANDVTLKGLPREPLRLEAFLPSTLDTATEPDSALVVTTDTHHNVLKAERKGVRSDECLLVPGATSDTCRIEVRDLAAGRLVRSNASKPVEADGLRLFWGDLHVHTSISDDSTAEDGPEAAPPFARDVMGHDFFGFADHVNCIRSDEWQARRIN